jgi:hypothetical protein
MFKQLFGFKPDGSDGREGPAEESVHERASTGPSSGSAGIGSLGIGNSFSSLKAARDADRLAEEESSGSSRRGSSRSHPPSKAAVIKDTPAPAFTDRRTAAELQTFEEIYRNAPVKPPKVAYASLGILRVVDMVHSPHLSGMSADAKRNAVLMALEAVGVKAEDLLQDAIVRQRALNDYEEAQQTKLKDFETSKDQENATIRAELDRLSAAHLTRIQENLELVTRQQDNLRTWTKRKEQESEQIAEAASFCTAQNASANGSLSATVTRFGNDAVVGKGDTAAAGKR